MSITAVTLDASSRVASWIEGDYQFRVTRDASGYPLTVRATSGGRRQMNGEFRYRSGVFFGMVGDVESAMIQRLISDAINPGGGGGGGPAVINDLTTGGATAALAAQQGVVLKGLVDAKADAAATTTALAGKAPRGTPGAALGATYTAADADDGKIWPTPVNVTVTVNTGLPSGFGLGFTGAGVVSFAGTAAVADKRTPGATNPVCGLINVGGNAYEAWGTKQ